MSNPIVIQPREDGLVHLTIAGGALLESPVWEQHYRGTNYLAIIDVSPEMPGGLGRHFINKGKGDCLYIVDQIAVLDAVEFAGDYTTGVGRRQRNRWYGVVASKTDALMTLIPCAERGQGRAAGDAVAGPAGCRGTADPRRHRRWQIMSGNPKTYPAGTVVEYTRPSWGSDQWVSGVIVNESDGRSYGIRRTGDPEDYFLQDIRISASYAFRHPP